MAASYSRAIMERRMGATGMANLGGGIQSKCARVEGQGPPLECVAYTDYMLLSWMPSMHLLLQEVSDTAAHYWNT